MADSNLNVQKGLLLSKKEQQKLYKRQNTAFLQEQVFTPGHTVRLLHKSVHIQVNLGTGHAYNIAVAGPIREAPKPPELDLEMTWIPIGVCDDMIEDRKRRNQERILSWRSWSGNTARLRITSVCGRYDIIDKIGSHVQATSVVYYPPFDTKEKRDAKADTMFDMYKITRVKNKETYSRVMRDWQKNQRSWETNLIEHKFFNRQNLKIFRSGTTADTIRAAIFLAKEDNRREEEGFFADSLTEELPEQRKKMKTVLVRGAELLATDSEQSDEEAVKTNRQKKLKKAMILDKCEKSDLVHLIMGYACEPGRTEAQLPLNPSHTDLQNHLNAQLKEGEAFAQRAYTELLKRQRTYDIVDKAAARAKMHVLDTNGVCYNDWFEPQQLQWAKDYRERNIQRVMQGREPEFIQPPSVTPIMFSPVTAKTGLETPDRTPHPQQPSSPAIRQKKTAVQVFDERTPGALNLACYVKGNFDQPLTAMHPWHQVPADIKTHIVQRLGKGLNSLQDQVVNSSCQALFALEVLYPTLVEVGIGLPKHLTGDMDHGMAVRSLMEKVRQADGLGGLIQWILASPIDWRDEIDGLMTLYKATRNPVAMETPNRMSLALAVTFLLIKIKSWGGELSDAAEQILCDSGHIIAAYHGMTREPPLIPSAATTRTSQLPSTTMNLAFVLSPEKRQSPQSTPMSAPPATSTQPVRSAASSSAPPWSTPPLSVSPAMSASPAEPAMSAPPTWTWPIIQ